MDAGVFGNAIHQRHGAGEPQPDGSRRRRAEQDDIGESREHAADVLGSLTVSGDMELSTALLFETHDEDGGGSFDLGGSDAIEELAEKPSGA